VNPVLPTLLVAKLAGAPVDVDRDEARDAARRELSEAAYRQHEPSLYDRVVGWVLERLLELLQQIGGGSGTRGFLGLLALAVLALLVIVAIRLRLGPLGAKKPADALFAGRERTAAEHRRAAEDLAGQGRWADAVRERLRAIIREFEQRGLLEPRPGRTADEAADEAGAALPEHAAGLRAGARIFDDVWYGGRPATADGYGRLRDLDEAIQGSRRTVAGVAR
jgi:hypothetical protein